MAYQTGTATSPTDLLQKIQAFIAANGWTIDQGAVDGTGYRLHAHRGAVYINLRSAIAELRDAGGTFTPAYGNNAFTGINIYTGDGYNAASDWRSQSGGPIGIGTAYNVGNVMPLPAGSIVAYHLFSNDSGGHIVCVIEKTSGIFTHLGWGISIEKSGTFTGGQYHFGAVDIYFYNNQALNYPGLVYSASTPGCHTNYSTTTNIRSYLKVAVDGGNWVGIGNTTAASGGSTGSIGSCNATQSIYSSMLIPSYQSVHDRAWSTLSNQAILLPVQFGALRSAGGYSMLGTLPHIYQTNACQRGLAAASEYLWGTDTFMIFPGPQNGPDGYAIRKVV